MGAVHIDYIVDIGAVCQLHITDEEDTSGA
jgi:hypothetical protein